MWIHTNLIIFYTKHDTRAFFVHISVALPNKKPKGIDSLIMRDNILGSLGKHLSLILSLAVCWVWFRCWMLWEESFDSLWFHVRIKQTEIP